MLRGGSGGPGAGGAPRHAHPPSFALLLRELEETKERLVAFAQVQCSTFHSMALRGMVWTLCVCSVIKLCALRTDSGYSCPHTVLPLDVLCATHGCVHCVQAHAINVGRAESSITKIGRFLDGTLTKLLWGSEPSGSSNTAGATGGTAAAGGSLPGGLASEYDWADVTTDMACTGGRWL